VALDAEYVAAAKKANDAMESRDRADEAFRRAVVERDELKAAARKARLTADLCLVCLNLPGCRCALSGPKTSQHHRRFIHPTGHTLVLHFATAQQLHQNTIWWQEQHAHGRCRHCADIEKDQDRAREARQKRELEEAYCAEIEKANKRAREARQQRQLEEARKENQGSP
jgi:hypothetical protein